MEDQLDDMGLWLPLELLDDDMFATPEQQVPPTMGFSGENPRPFGGFAPDLGFPADSFFLSGEGKNGFSTGTTSPDGPSMSPPSTPSVHSDDEVMDLIYAVADEIAGIRLQEQQQQQNHWNFAAAANRFTPASNFAGTGYYASATSRASTLQQLQFQRLKQEQQFKQKNRDRNGRVRGAAWPSVHGHHELAGTGMMAISFDGTRKGSAGTGVFIPKMAGKASRSEPRKKSGFPKVLVPARVVHALNLDLDELGVLRRYPGGYVVDRGTSTTSSTSTLRGEKQLFSPNAAAAVDVAGDEIRLPPEWTY